MPDWFPGTGWKAKARQFRSTLIDTVGAPYQFVKDQMVGRFSCCKGYNLSPFPPLFIPRYRDVGDTAWFMLLDSDDEVD